MDKGDKKKTEAVFKANIGGSMKAKELRTWLSKRYQRSLSEILTKILQVLVFDDFVANINAGDFALKIASWINKSEYDLRLFAFKVFDVHRDHVTNQISSKDKITQESLFTFIEFFKKGSMLSGGKKFLEAGEILSLE